MLASVESFLGDPLVKDLIGFAGIIFTAWFGLRLKARFEKPKVSLRLFSSDGDVIQSYQGPFEHYFHVLIENGNRFGVARNVGLFVVGVASKKSDGTFQRREVPPIRLDWPYEGAFREKDGPSVDRRRNVHFQEICDLCNFKESGSIKLALPFKAATLEGDFREPGTVRLYLRALGDNFHQRRDLGVEITWTGTWPRPEQERAECFSVSEVR